MAYMIGLLIPFLGTTLGAGCVFFMKDKIKDGIQRALLGFASGVMIAASVWSLLIPAIDMSSAMGKMSFIPAVVGMMLGIAFLYLLDKLIPHLHMNEDTPEGPKTKLGKTMMLVLAVTLHNIPEGMAVGVVFAGLLGGDTSVTVAGAMALSIGIAIQNFPEGAIISLPLRAEGNSKGKSFFYGVASGVVEPIFGGLTLLMAGFITPVLPYFLSFAAGAMIYVVIEELLPEASGEGKTDICTWGFAFGFATEGRSITIGRDCLFSSDLVFRTGDSHSLTDLSGRRINPARDITVGDHVWIGHRALICKGVVLPRDCVVGTGAVVTRGAFDEHTVIAGSPARTVRQNVSWDIRRLPANGAEGANE